MQVGGNGGLTRGRLVYPHETESGEGVRSD
jgi:hypothetical protein